MRSDTGIAEISSSDIGFNIYFPAFSPQKGVRCVISKFIHRGNGVLPETLLLQDANSLGRSHCCCYRCGAGQ